MKKKIKSIIIPLVITFIITATALLSMFADMDKKIQYLDYIDYQVTMNQDR